MMSSRKVLTYFVVFYIAVLLVQHAVILIKIQQVAVTGRASGEVNFCINRPPIINYPCPLSTLQNDEYQCDVNLTDQDGNSIDFQLDFLPPPAIFDMTDDFKIEFTPNQSHIGNHTFRITAWDYSPCSNNLYYRDFVMEVIDVNDPPILLSPIPNQTWNQGDPELAAFDLDVYFYDPDGDPLRYGRTALANIAVRNDSNHVIYFWSLPDWSGTEYIVFTAYDPYMANASSNVVELNVIPIPEEVEPSPSGGSSGGGGGGGFVPECIPQWYCRPWGPCLPDNLRYRECYDLNNCSTDFGKPNVTEPCEFTHTCFDGIQAPDEEGVDCGGPCPPCGSCYDNTCNNNEDCTKGLISIPDCGGPCQECVYLTSGSCFDSICNNNEDCTLGLSDIPDCGGPCPTCPELERPEITRAINWFLLILLLVLIIIAGYVAKQTYPGLKFFVAKRKKKRYEERLMLETKISEDIYETLTKLEDSLGKEDIEKLLMLFSTAMRRYFKNLLDLRYEFTYEELMDEINHRNINPTLKSVLKNFFDRSIELEFSGKSVSKQELGAMISEFKHIVAHTSEEPLKEEKEKAKPTSKKLSAVDKIYVKISEAETSLRRGELNEAYFKYLRVVHDFHLLSAKEKEKLHGFVSRLYEEIKLARQKYSYEETKE